MNKTKCKVLQYKWNEKNLVWSIWWLVDKNTQTLYFDWKPHIKHLGVLWYQKIQIFHVPGNPFNQLIKRKLSLTNTPKKNPYIFMSYTILKFKNWHIYYIQTSYKQVFKPKLKFTSSKCYLEELHQRLVLRISVWLAAVKLLRNRHSCSIRAVQFIILFIFTQQKKKSNCYIIVILVCQFKSWRETQRNHKAQKVSMHMPAFKWWSTAGGWGTCSWDSKDREMAIPWNTQKKIIIMWEFHLRHC